MAHRTPTPVALRDKHKHRIVKLFHSLTEKNARKNRRNEHREDQRPEQGERNRPGHWLEQAAFDRLEGEDRQIRGNDDADRVKHGPLHLMRRLANPFEDRLRRVLLVVAHMPNNVLNHYDRAIHDHAEIERPER